MNVHIFCKTDSPCIANWVVKRKGQASKQASKTKQIIIRIEQGAIQLLRSHSVGEGGFLKMRAKANRGEGGFLPSRTVAKKNFF